MTAPLPNPTTGPEDDGEDLPFDPTLSAAMDALFIARESVDEALAILERKAGLR